MVLERPDIEWDVVHRGTPLDLRDHAEELARAAGMAPSLHNAQPWQFRVGEDLIEARIDMRRKVPVLDPDNRQLLIGVGAAVFVLRLGVALLGRRPRTVLFPDTWRSSIAAIVSAGERADPLPLERLLMDQVPLRRTVRGLMAPEMPGRVRAEFAAHAAHEAAALHWVVREGERQRLAELICGAERRQQQNLRLRDELLDWVAGPTLRSGLGIPAWAVGMRGPGSERTRFPQRDFLAGQPGSMVQLPEREPTLAILTTPGGGQLQALQAGQALMRVLLAATAEGYAASYLNQPLEFPGLRTKVRDQLSLAGEPQLIIRLGQPVGVWPPATPRQPVRKTLRILPS